MPAPPRSMAGRIAAAIVPVALSAMSALAAAPASASAQPASQVLTTPVEARMLTDSARAAALRDAATKTSLGTERVSDAVIHRVEERAPSVVQDTARVAPRIRVNVQGQLRDQSVEISSPVVRQTATGTVASLQRVDLERVLGASSSELKVVRPAGVAPLSRADTVRLSAGDFVFRKMSDTARRVSGGESVAGESPAASPPVYELPYSWLTIDSAGAVLILRPRVEFVGGGLSYDPRQRVLRGRALVGVEDVNNPTAGMQLLPRPLRMQLTLTREGEAKPTRLAIEHTSLDYSEVEIWTTATDSVQVRISTGADTAGVFVPIRLYGPQLGLQLRQSVLQAFGLASTELTLTAPRGIARGDTILVQLGAAHVDVSPATVVLTPGSVAQARVRSGSPGRYAIHARIDGMDAGTIPVTFVWPWSFLSAALVGVGLGALSTFVSGKRRKPWSRYPRAYVTALPFGLITAAAATLGLDWLQLRLDGGGGWIGVVVTAALGAWAGRRVLDAATGGMTSGDSDGARPAPAAT